MTRSQSMSAGMVQRARIVLLASRVGVIPRSLSWPGQNAQSTQTPTRPNTTSTTACTTSTETGIASNTQAERKLQMRGRPHLTTMVVSENAKFVSGVYWLRIDA